MSQKRSSLEPLSRANQSLRRRLGLKGELMLAVASVGRSHSRIRNSATNPIPIVYRDAPEPERLYV